MAAVKRRINSTGRRRIAHEHVSVSMLSPGPGGIPRARTTLKLDGMSFPATARIVVEAYHSSTGMRFDCGTIGAPAIPDALLLVDIDPSSSVLFRLKIVDNDIQPGRLLGAADRLRPDSDENPEGRRSLFPIREQELHQEIWRVRIDDAGPVLQLNFKLPNLKARILKDPLVGGVLLPAALRLVLEHIAGEFADDDEEEGSWQSDWMKYCREELKLDDPDFQDKEDAEAWVNSGVRAFCKSRNFLSEIRKAMGESQ